jgi:hypothetical protein
VGIAGVYQNPGFRIIFQDSFNQVSRLPSFAFIGIRGPFDLVRYHSEPQPERDTNQISFLLSSVSLCLCGQLFLFFLLMA